MTTYTADQSFPDEPAHLLDDDLPVLQRKYPFTAIKGRDWLGFEEITSMTGPTDPESDFAGAVITLTRVNCLDIKPGMQLAALAPWYLGGIAQPANAMTDREVKDVHVEEKLGRRRHSFTWGLVSAIVTVTYTDGVEQILLHDEDRPEYAWIVSGI
ncbi:hypothetical protein AB0395_48250 [Streptosporangium sp. NPDC051023]|uniref:hypothetical protein n=1 Tax=Streptosporangium sp. NPDC051023 TaxID=3155410 RepID=UPI00344C3E5C